jgi:peptidyl-prolyl cis-trans isomerase-like protein 2
MTSLNLLAIKPKTWRDLISDEPFTRSDIIAIQDPNNLASRDLREYDYVKSGRKVTDDEMEGDPLKGINVDAAGGAGKVLKMIAEKVYLSPYFSVIDFGADNRHARNRCLRLNRSRRRLWSLKRGRSN